MASSQTGYLVTWYKDGLKFKCTGCGKCCTGTSGYVFVSDKEVEELASFLKISVTDFKCKYTRFAYGKLALLEKKRGEDYDCIFLKGKQCEVYPARPQQCRKYPWWESNLKSKKSWEETAGECEGIDHPDAPVVSLKEITEALKEDLLRD